MKMSVTLRSTSSIVNRHGISDSQVRFNRFTGKAIVVGSSGSRFGLVSWVRKLYTTSSYEKIQKFLMDGIAKEHRNSEGLGLYLQTRMKKRTLGIRTVKGLRQWHKDYERLNRDYASLVERNKRTDAVLSEVTTLMKAFNADPGKFATDVSLQNCSRFYSSPALSLRIQSVESASPGPLVEAAALFRLFPINDNGGVYYAAVLENVKDGLLRSQSALCDVPGDLGVYARGVSGECKDVRTAKATAEGCFHVWLSQKFIRECKVCVGLLDLFSKEYVEFGLFCSAEGSTPLLGNRVKKLLDMHYRIEKREDSSGEMVKVASFREELQGDTALRKKVGVRLAAKFIEHNRGFDKAIDTSGTFLEHLPSEYMDKGQRSASLDAILLQELDQIYLEYNKNISEEHEREKSQIGAFGQISESAQGDSLALSDPLRNGCQ